MAKANKSSVEPHWHADFRIAEELPDIKVVRTTFLVNFLVFVLLLGLIGTLIFREMRAAEVNGLTEALQQDIQQNTRENREKLKLNNEFRDASKMAEDLDTFYTKVYDLQAIAEAIAESCPENIYIQSLSLNHQLSMSSGRRARLQGRNAVISFKGVLEVPFFDDVKQIETYREMLQELEVFEGQVASVSIPMPRQAAAPNQYEFSVTIVLEAQ